MSEESNREQQPAEEQLVEVEQVVTEEDATVSDDGAEEHPEVSEEVVDEVQKDSREEESDSEEEPKEETVELKEVESETPVVKEDEDTSLFNSVTDELEGGDDSKLELHREKVQLDEYDSLIRNFDPLSGLRTDGIYSNIYSMNHAEINDYVVQLSEQGLGADSAMVAASYDAYHKNLDRYNKAKVSVESMKQQYLQKKVKVESVRHEGEWERIESVVRKTSPDINDSQLQSVAAYLQTKLANGYNEPGNAWAITANTLDGKMKVFKAAARDLGISSLFGANNKTTGSEPTSKAPTAPEDSKEARKSVPSKGKQSLTEEQIFEQYKHKDFSDPAILKEFHKKLEAASG